MELRTPSGRPDSSGDGSTTDTQGRYNVTSHLGIQVFDPTGRLAGIIPKPTSKGSVSVAFAGPDHAWLYACAADKVFRRKTQAKGALSFQPPKRLWFLICTNSNIELSSRLPDLITQSRNHVTNLAGTLTVIVKNAKKLVKYTSI